MGFFSVKYCFLNHRLALEEIAWDLELHHDPELQVQALPKEDNADPEAEGQWGDPFQMTQAWPAINGARDTHFGSLD